MDWGLCIGVVLVLAAIGLVFGGVLEFLEDLAVWVVSGLIIVGIAICLISILF